MTRRRQANVGTNGFGSLPSLVDVVPDANATGGYVLARGVPVEQNIRLFDLQRNWVQTTGHPAIVAFADPDNYIEGRFYLRDYGDTAASQQWHAASPVAVLPAWDVPEGRVEYQGRFYDYCLSIRKFTDGVPEVLSERFVPAASYAENFNEEFQLSNQPSRTTLTLCVLPSHDLEDCTVVLTAMTERTYQSNALGARGYQSTYWVAAVNATTSIDSMLGLAGSCKPAYRAPDNAATQSPFFDPISAGLEAYQGPALASRLTTFADCPALVPFSAKKTEDFVVLGQTGPSDSLVPPVSTTMQKLDLVRVGEANNTNPLSYNRQMNWEYVAGGVLPFNYDLFSPVSLAENSNATVRGEKAGFGFYDSRYPIDLFDKDALKRHRRAFYVVGSGPASSCASWSDNDEPPPDTLTVAASGGSGAIVFNQWLPPQIVLGRLPSASCAMDSVYSASVDHTDSRLKSFSTDEQETVHVTGQLLIMFSAACSPYVYLDETWKHKHVKACVADIFYSLKLETSAGRADVTQRWIEGDLQVYRAGLEPANGVYGSISSFGLSNIYSARFFDSINAFSIVAKTAGATSPRNLSPGDFSGLQLSYVSEGFDA